MAEFTICPSNWASFQHYKDRAPSWIKLHRSMILDNPKWHRLPTMSKAIAPCIWLLASEVSDGAIISTMEDLAFRLRVSEKDAKAALIPLIDAEFFVLVQDASGVLAECKQSASGVLAQNILEENKEETREDDSKDKDLTEEKRERKPKTREVFDDYCKEIGLPPSETQKAWLYWHQEHEWKNVKCWKARLQTWKINWEKRDGKKDPDLRTEGTRFVSEEAS